MAKINIKPLVNLLIFHVAYILIISYFIIEFNEISNLTEFTERVIHDFKRDDYFGSVYLVMFVGFMIGSRNVSADRYLSKDLYPVNEVKKEESS